MRTNLPVNNVEYELPDGNSIVSRTDVRGTITYVNSAFVEASGFEEKELLGQPHNLVRHPDMPPEAFEDLWRTLKSGRPWTGVVKNRRKDGGFYWVIANVTPMFESGDCVGYLSVRHKPTRTQIEAHESVYRQFREGKRGNLRIKEGKAVAGGGLRQVFDKLGNLTERARIIAVFALMGLALVGNLLLAWYADGQSDAKMQDIATRRMVLNNSISEMAFVTTDIRSMLLLALQHDPAGKYSKMHDHPLNKHMDQIQAGEDSLTKFVANLEANVRSDKGKAVLAEVKRTRALYLNEGVTPARQAVLAGNFDQAVSLLLTKVNPLHDQAEKAIQAMSRHELEGARHAYERAVEEGALLTRIQIGIFVGSVLVAIVMLTYLLRSIVGSLRAAGRQLNRIAQGNYHDEIEIKRADETGLLMYAMKSMQIRMGFEVSDARRIANEMTRVKFGLDNVSTNVMIADKNRRIIYMNKAVVEMFRRAQNDIRKDFPNFDESALLGSSIDSFHKNPAHQAQLLERLRGVHKASIKMGGRTFALTASSVVNEVGELLGAAVEWVDRTDELAVEAEISNIITAATNGDFRQRVASDGKSGFFLQMAHSINQLLQTCDHGLREVITMLGSLSRGDLSCQIDSDARGAFGQLNSDANATVEQLKNMLSQIKEATDTINTATREIAAGNLDLSQRTEMQASNLEETAASMEELTSTVNQTADNAAQANQLANSASTVAERGGSVVVQVIGTMSSINESSKKIVDIIGVIDSIAFQTNILALNAAVEAARAGDQGRGFGVVASEVRSLAQRSAAAAKEIKTLIGDSVGKVESGSRLVNEAGQTMEEIVSAVRRVTDIMSEISAATREQSIGIQQVNQAITQLESVTHQNAALVEQASAAAASLESEAKNLSNSVSVFKMGSVHDVEPAPTRLAAPSGRRPGATEKRRLPGATAKPKALAVSSGTSSNQDWEDF